MNRVARDVPPRLRRMLRRTHFPPAAWDARRAPMGAARAGNWTSEPPGSVYGCIKTSPADLVWE